MLWDLFVRWSGWPQGLHAELRSWAPLFEGQLVQSGRHNGAGGIGGWRGPAWAARAA